MRLPSDDVEAGCYKLPAVLDLNAAAPLAEELLRRNSTNLRIDASDVRHMGGLCLQVLLSAQKEWRKNNLRFGLHSLSDDFKNAAAILGAGSHFNLDDGALAA